MNEYRKFMKAQAENAVFILGNIQKPEYRQCMKDEYISYCMRYEYR